MFINQQWVSQPKTRPQDRPRVLLLSPPVFKTFCLLWRYFERISSNSKLLTGARRGAETNSSVICQDARRLSPRVTKP